VRAAGEEVVVQLKREPRGQTEIKFVEAFIQEGEPAAVAEVVVLVVRSERGLDAEPGAHAAERVGARNIDVGVGNGKGEWP